MRELSCIFTNAKETRIFRDDSEIAEIINAILHSDKTVHLDWDKEAGEDWIRFYRQESGLICMIHRRIGIAFVRLSNSGTLLTRCLRDIYIVEVESFSLDEWCIDLSYLYEYISEIHWNASPYAINTDRMSLSDLYYATV